MILALDIGNTNITMGVFDGRDLKFVSRLATDRQRTEDQYAVELRDIVDIYGVSIGEIEGSIISSVVPSLTSGIKRAVKRLTRTVPLCIGPSMLGGVIIPGPGIALEALTARSALLSSVSLEAPKHVIGSNTADCMRSGSVYGTASMMDGMCDRIEEELGKKCSIVATGGLGKEIVPHCRRNIVYCDNLLLEGLRLLYEKNTCKAGR